MSGHACILHYSHGLTYTNDEMNDKRGSSLPRLTLSPFLLKLTVSQSSFDYPFLGWLV